MIFDVPELEDLGNVSGKSVLVRVDFNVPLDEGGQITDDFRIRSALPTLRWLVDQGASVTACSHLGRPKGEVNPKFSLEPVRSHLASFLPEVSLLENLRFNPGEVANDPGFVDELVAGHDFFVNDAFGASHRSHASVVGVPSRVPSAAGRLLANEVGVLLGVRKDPRRPLVAVMGGAKVSDKLGVIEALLDHVDSLVIGGGMAYTFQKSLGHSIGNSLCEDDMVETTSRLLKGEKPIHLPVDGVAIAPGGKLCDTDDGSEVRIVGVDVPDEWASVDIGPETAAVFSEIIADAGTVLWNGPMGVFEDTRFSAGTETVAHAIAETDAFTIVGGGDSAAAAKKFGVDNQVDHVSTGGGASLELIEKGDLPGLAALRS